MSKDTLVKLKHKREIHRQLKQGHTFWEEYRVSAQECRDGIRKVKAFKFVKLCEEKELLQVCYSEKKDKRNSTASTVHYIRPRI